MLKCFICTAPAEYSVKVHIIAMSFQYTKRNVCETCLKIKQEEQRKLTALRQPK